MEFGIDEKDSTENINVYFGTNYVNSALRSLQSRYHTDITMS